MTPGTICNKCKGTGMVECTAGTREGSFSPDEMPCVHCHGMGRRNPEPQSKEEAAVMLADALQRATDAKSQYRQLQYVYSRWVHGIHRDEDGHRT